MMTLEILAKYFRRIFFDSQVLRNSTPVTYAVLFYLPVGHWMKIYTCPN